MYEEKIADLTMKIQDANAQNSSAGEEIEKMKKQVANCHRLLEVDYYILMNEYFLSFLMFLHCFTYKNYTNKPSLPRIMILSDNKESDILICSLP